MLLAVDTSTKMMGIALRSEHEILSETMGRTRNYHTVELGQSVERTLRRQAITPGEVKALGVALGPGSFTGLRIGLAFVKGFAYARNIPIYGVPTLDIYAHSLPVEEDKDLVAMLQAGRGRLAVGWYRPAPDGWSTTGDLHNLTLDELLERFTRPTVLTGEIPEELHHRIADHELLESAEPALAIRRPGMLADLAWQRWKSGSDDDPASLSPIYLQRGS